MVIEIICLALLILHLTISFIFYILVKAEILHVSMHLFPLVLLVPVWGALMAMAAEWHTRRGLSGSKQIEIDRLGLADDDYRTMMLADDEEESPVVPLEEAIVINDAETRRKMMIDILQQDPKQYVNLLQKARYDEDIEVTHYASTAIMEVQREYELEIQRCERLMQENPDDAQTLELCMNAYKAYIESGLMAVNILSMQRARYQIILDKQLSASHVNREIYFAAADNLLELGRLDDAKRLLDTITENWRLDERGWMLLVKYFYKINSPYHLQQTVLKLEGMYLSPAGKEFVAFWKK